MGSLPDEPRVTHDRQPRGLSGAIVTAWNAFNHALDIAGVAVLSTVILMVVLQIYCRFILNAALDWPEEVARWG